MDVQPVVISMGDLSVTICLIMVAEMPVTKTVVSGRNEINTMQ